MAHNKLEHLQYNNIEAKYDLQKNPWTVDVE